MAERNGSRPTQTEQNTPDETPVGLNMEVIRAHSLILLLHTCLRHPPKCIREINELISVKSSFRRSALVGASVDGTPVGYKPQTNKEV